MDRPTNLRRGGFYTKQPNLCEEIHKPSAEANICLTCPKPKCRPTVCKRLKEEKKALKEAKNGKK